MNVSYAKVEGIIGGNWAKPGQFKFPVSVQLDRIHGCTGGIIHEYFAVSAAHCLVNATNNFKQGSVSIVAGVVSVKEKRPRARVFRRFEVERAYVPRSFEERIGDILILRVSKGFGLARSPHLVKLKLPPLTEEPPSYEGAEAVVTGFGAEAVSLAINEDTQELEEQDAVHRLKLKHAQTDVLPAEVCLKSGRPAPFRICAKMRQRHPTKSEGTCLGDSGAPLVLDDNTVIGILNTSPLGCIENMKPAVYTRVTYFRKFIDDVIEDEPSMEIRSCAYPLE